MNIIHMSKLGVPYLPADMEKVDFVRKLILWTEKCLQTHIFPNLIKANKIATISSTLDIFERK